MDDIQTDVLQSKLVLSEFPVVVKAPRAHGALRRLLRKARAHWPIFTAPRLTTVLQEYICLHRLSKRGDDPLDASSIAYLSTDILRSTQEGEGERREHLSTQKTEKS